MEDGTGKYHVLGIFCNECYYQSGVEGFHINRGAEQAFTIPAYDLAYDERPDHIDNCGLVCALVRYLQAVRRERDSEKRKKLEEEFFPVLAEELQGADLFLLDREIPEEERGEEDTSWYVDEVEDGDIAKVERDGILYYPIFTDVFEVCWYLKRETMPVNHTIVTWQTLRELGRPLIINPASLDYILGPERVPLWEPENQPD